MRPSYATMHTGQPTTAERMKRTIQLTLKGWLAVELERRRREHPELDPVEDWVMIPDWMLDGRRAAAEPSRQGEA